MIYPIHVKKNQSSESISFGGAFQPRVFGWFTCIALCILAPQSLLAQAPDPSASQNQESVTANGVARIHEQDFSSGKTNQQPEKRQIQPPAKTSEKIIDHPSTEGESIDNIGEFSTSGLPAIDYEISELDLSSPVTASPGQLENDSAEDQFDETGNSGNVWGLGSLTDRKNLPSTIQMFISVASISLVPAILLMTTCFIRIVVVLGILRQAIGLQQLPPTQVTTALALMLTFLIMAPTWKKIKNEAIDPYSAPQSTMSWDDAWEAGVTPIKTFMWRQIQQAENENDFWIFYDYLPEEEKSKEPESYSDLPLKVILPAFMISELKVAFLIGIQILLPFLILDIVVASFCNTMGLIMMPPTVVSLPLKLLLFVMVDGWNLIVGMLLNSFATLT